jgi:hypothetical protein
MLRNIGARCRVLPGEWFDTHDLKDAKALLNKLAI